MGFFVPLAVAALSGLPGLEISKFVLSLERIERIFSNRDLESIIGRMIETMGEQCAIGSWVANAIAPGCIDKPRFKISTKRIG